MARYLGGLITKDESLVIPANNFEDTSAPGVWTLEEAQALNKQGLWPTAGVSNPAKFIENIFSIDTYTGDGSARTITTGIDLVNNSGLVWIKNRTSSENNFLCDTVRGAPNHLNSDSNAGQGSFNNSFGAFTSTGFTLAGAADVVNSVSGANNDYVAWTFRKAPKFFDVVTYTGTGSSSQQVSHNLGQNPGMVICKRTDSTGDWGVWHRGTGSVDYTGLKLNGTNASGQVNPGLEGQFTSTYFKPIYVYDPSNTATMNINGATYVAYLFGHDTSSDGMIQCGTFTGTGSQITTTLGFEPQWLLYKRTDSSAGGGWGIVDSLRGWIEGGNSSNFQYLAADSTDAEAESSGPGLVSTGFTSNHTSGRQYIYIAIRKAPMQTPTSRASVFDVELGGSSVADNGLTINTGFPVDLAMFRDNYASGGSNSIKDRLRGNKVLATELTNNESGGSTYQSFDSNDGLINRAGGSAGNLSGGIYYAWRRAPGYFDIVAYTGNGSDGRTINHNLGVVPDMIWFKIRDNANADAAYTRGWVVTSRHLPNATATNDTTLYLNTNAAELDEAIMYDVAPTSTVFSVSTDPHVNFTNVDYVAYLFANLAGISKVGTFSHTNGSSTDVDCGFSSGSSFVIVKRTDSTGDWYHWDSVRGIVSGNDPYLLLNTNAAQNSSYDYIDPLNSGFQIASGFTTGSYFFYAIAA
jgi:hypothetical protein